MAGSAQFLVNMRLSLIVLRHFTAAGTAAHADVFQGSAKTGRLMTLEMRQRNHNVGVHDGASDVCCFAVFTVTNRHFNVVRTAQAVADQDLASGCLRIEAVDLRTFQMLQRVFTAARIERVAVGKERNAAKFLNNVRHCLRVVRTQIRKIPQLSEMHLDRDKFAVHINCADSCRADQHPAASS